MAWTALAKAANLASLSELVSPYISFDLENKRFHVLSQRERSFAFREQSQYLLNGKDAVNNEADLNSGV